MSFAKLKVLKSRKVELESRKQELVRKRRECDSEFQGIVAKLKKLSIEIDKLTVKDVVVSEHAVLRFAERIMGLNCKEVESLILTPDFIKTVHSFGGNGRFPINGKATAVVKNNVVTTVLTKEGERDE